MVCDIVSVTDSYRPMQVISWTANLSPASCTKILTNRHYNSLFKSRDVNEVSKKILGLKKIFLDEKFLDPKFALEQMWALKCL